jgi:glycosyltransferase involved in cell wall biosynthesis
VKAGPEVSVVIPTLGGEWLLGTIERVNAGTLVPNEILVCIPESRLGSVRALSVPNIRIVPTACLGQVAQRAVGFQLARSPFILQLDDDVLLEPDCLHSLFEYSQKNPGRAVGPAFYDERSGTYYSFRCPSGAQLNTYERFLYWVINGSRGYQPGQIGSSGINMGVPEQGDWEQLGWLPGGCILHRQEALEKSAFYPYSGKAFAEDLFHAHFLRRKGVVLARCGAAKCSIVVSSLRAPKVVSTLKSHWAYSKAMRRYLRLVGGSKLRLHVYLALNLVESWIRRIRCCQYVFGQRFT